MAFTIPEALKRVQNTMMGGILKSIATTDELGALISIEAVDGTSIKLDREGTLPSTTFIPDTGVATEESSGTDDVPEVQFRRIVGSLDTDLLATAGNDPGTQARLVGKKAKATWRTVKAKLISGGHTTGFAVSATTASITAMDYSAHLDSARRGPGSIKYTQTGTLWQFRAPGDITYGTAVAVAADSTVTLASHNPSFFIRPTIDVSAATANFEIQITFTSSNNEFDGLWEMADPAMVTDLSATNGTAFSLAQLDDLIDRQKVREDRAFLMNGKIVNKYYAALRSTSLTPDHVAIPGYSGQVPVYRGIRILTVDNIVKSVQGSNYVSNMALVSLNADEGLVIAAQTAGGGAGAFTVDADPRDRSVLGFRIEDVGLLEGKDARRTRVKWYGAPVLKSLLSCAVTQGIIEEAT